MCFLDRYGYVLAHHYWDLELYNSQPIRAGGTSNKWIVTGESVIIRETWGKHYNTVYCNVKQNKE